MKYIRLYNAVHLNQDHSCSGKECVFMLQWRLSENRNAGSVAVLNTLQKSCWCIQAFVKSETSVVAVPTDCRSLIHFACC